MLLFPDETRVYKLFHLWFVYFHNLGTKPSLLLFDLFGVRVDVKMMYRNLEIEPGHVLIIPSEDIYISRMSCIRCSFSEGDKLSLMKMGLGLASSLRFTWVTLSSVGGSHCSKCVSQRVFKCLIYRSESDWINSLGSKVSSPPSSKWLADTMFTERLPKIFPALTSESHDDVTDELSW